MSQLAPQFEPTISRKFNEVKEGLFSNKSQEAVILLPVNAYVKNNGKAVMSSGCALVAKERFRGIDLNWGKVLEVQGRRRGNLGMLKTEARGNFPAIIWEKLKDPTIVACPTQWHFVEPADLSLIERSISHILAMADRYQWENIYLPELGCGAGGRSWIEDIRPILTDYLDSRFTVCHLSNPESWQKKPLTIATNEADLTTNLKGNQ